MATEPAWSLDEAHEDFIVDLQDGKFPTSDELKQETYQISSSVAFVVDQPKIREIWSATFRDRIVHHIIFNRLESNSFRTEKIYTI